MRQALALILVLMLAPALAACAGHIPAANRASSARASSANVLPDSVYLKPHRLVALPDGRRLNLFCMGRGVPTVLLDSGLGDNIRVWRKVQAPLARETRVCSYDRAGYGFSDPRSGPRPAYAAVDDIHQLLKAAHIPGPVLYVGHSNAGLYALRLQARHPEDIAGAVLVDPSFAGQLQRLSAVLPKPVRAGAVALYMGQLAQARACITAPRPLPGDCIGREGGPGNVTPALAAVEKAQIARRGYLKAKAAELADILTGKPPPHRPGFGAKPLIVLTHGAMTYPGLTPGQNARVEQTWRDEHKALAALSRRGQAIVVEGSSHFIQFDHPQAVIAAVTRVLGELGAH